MMPTVNPTSAGGISGELKQKMRFCYPSEVRGADRNHSGLPRPRNTSYVWLSHRHTPTDTTAECVSRASSRVDDGGSGPTGGERFVLSRKMEM